LEVFLVCKLICRQWLRWLLLQGRLHWALYHLLLHWHLRRIWYLSLLHWLWLCLLQMYALSSYNNLLLLLLFLHNSSCFSLQLQLLKTQLMLSL